MSQFDQSFQIIKEDQPAGLPEAQQQLIPSNCKSDFMDEYYRLMRGSFESIGQSVLTAGLLSQGIKYTRQHMQEKLQIAIEEYSSNYEALELNVSYGYFSASLYLINIDSKKTFSHSTESFAGAFGSVEKCFVDGRPYAVKSVGFDEESFLPIFWQVVKECFLLKIASALKIGPNADNIFGFDIVAFQNCFDFSMEFCEPASLVNNSRSLQKSLSIMHHFNIVHMDIKPENIAFSQHQNQNIFIDFGLSRAIMEPIGEKSHTRFTGSFIFCSNEMLDLYTKQTTGIVDLYYNDAYCLNETLIKDNTNSSQPKQEIQQTAQRRQFGLNDMFLMHKYQLFTLACQATESISFSQIAYLILIPKLRSFILTLPQQLNISQYYNSILSKKYQYGQKSDQQEQNQSNKVLDDRSQLFQQRFNRIIHTGKNAMIDETLLFSQKEEKMLIDGQALKQTRFGIYCLSLIRFIKINGGNHSFQKKIIACKVYSQHFLKEFSYDNDISLYRKVVQSIFVASLGSKQPQRYQILRNCVQTVAIMEIVPEDTFIQAYFTVFDWENRFIPTVRLAYEFLTVLQIVRQKNFKSYKYDRLVSIFIKKLSSFINEYGQQTKDPSQQFILLKIRVIVVGLTFLDSQLNDIKIVKQLQLAPQFTAESRRLNDQLKAYILYLNIKSTMIQYDFCDYKKVIALQRWINRLSQHSNRFTYAHFILFKVYCMTNQIQAVRKVYKHYHRQFKDYKELKQLSLFIMNNIHTLKFMFSHIIFHLSQHKLSFNPDTKQLDDIFHQIDCAIKESNNCSEYFMELLYIPTLTSNAICSKYLYSLIINNRETITRVVFLQHPKGRHVNNLRKTILLLNNLAEFATTYQQSYLVQKTPEHTSLLLAIAKSLKICEEIIDKSDCLECKVFGIIQIKMITDVRDSILQQFQRIFEFFIMSLKHKQLICNTSSILIMMVRLCQIHIQISQKYRMLNLFYFFIRQNKRLYLCLTNLKEVNLFINVYLSIQQNDPDEMVSFIYQLSKELGQRQSIVEIDQFYESQVDLIRASKENHYVQFKRFINRILSSLFQDFNLNNNPYLCIFFIAALQIRIKSKYECQVLKTICLSLNIVDTYTKKLVLSKYYYHYSNFQNFIPRKDSYLKVKHFKNTFDKIPLKYLLKSRVKIVKRNHSKIKEKMQRYIESYYCNLGIIK